MELTGLSDKGAEVLALELKDSNSTPQIKSHLLTSEANSSYHFCPFMCVVNLWHSVASFPVNSAIPAVNLHLEPFLPIKHQGPCVFKEPW